MRLTPAEFMATRHKAVTLVGMSGVGKTTLAYKLPSDSWFHYSGDYRIGTKYLSEPILDDIKRQAMGVPFLAKLLRSDSIYIGANITVHNLKPISTFLGKIGNPALGGLAVDEFRRRQRLHREAEIGAMQDVAQFIVKAREIYGYENLLNDAGGSLCELDDPATLAQLARDTVLVYLRADEAMEDALVKRSVEDPKPLYYNEAFFDLSVAAYLEEHDLGSVSLVDPDHFVRWVFPHLVAHRRPRYEAIARDYGYAIDARDLEDVRDEQDWLALVASAL